MTEDVILTVSGQQMDLGEDAASELITAASYYYRNGKHYILYDERDPETGAQTDSILKLDRERVDVIRRGADRVHMVFEKGRGNKTNYRTSAGNIMTDIYTADIRLQETPEEITADMSYSLYMNQMFISECQVQIRVMAKDHAKLNLMWEGM